VPDGKGSSARHETMNEGIEIRVEPDETATLQAAADVLIERLPQPPTGVYPICFLAFEKWPLFWQEN
jgi:hypothetical protein